eukprot:m.334561 g.334561  ORF g.334561 m.334561 type:complete len:174 (+) comp17384_c0_seq1:112-633(+)
MMKLATFLLLSAVTCTRFTDAQTTNCTFTVTDPGFGDGGEPFKFNLNSLFPKAGMGIPIGTAGQRILNVNLCNGAKCPCLNHASAICDCDSKGSPDYASLSTRKVTALPASFGAGLQMDFGVVQTGAVHKTRVVIICDHEELGLRLLNANTVGDGHGGISFAFAARAACGVRG